jgi:ribosomal protein S6--L-glutamate ligase
VAGAIVDYVADNVQYPELDIRQRLTVSRGYGVVELYVGEQTGMAGRTVDGSGLRDRDIVVLSLHREGKVIPNPRGTRELHIGDRLLCFGKYANVKDLLPEEVAQHRRRKLRPRPDGGSTPPAAR